MICYIIKQFDRRKVGTEMSHLPDRLAQSLITKGYLSETAPETQLEVKEAEQAEVIKTAPETQLEIPEIKEVKPATKHRGRPKQNQK